MLLVDENLMANFSNRAQREGLARQCSIHARYMNDTCSMLATMWFKINLDMLKD